MSYFIASSLHMLFNCMYLYVMQTIDFADRQKAISFISLIDGYYRLQEDYHCHLCKDVESPMLNALRSLRCHGPVRYVFTSIF